MLRQSARARLMLVLPQQRQQQQQENEPAVHLKHLPTKNITLLSENCMLSEKVMLLLLLLLLVVVVAAEVATVQACGVSSG
jgi:hypothetical protein